MFDEEKKQQFAGLLSSVFIDDITVQHMHLQGGGCINKAAILETNIGKIFVKWNYNSLREMFDVEKKGLEELRQADVITIPQVMGLIDEHDESFLFLEMIEAQTSYPNYWQDFGQKLAQMHQITQTQYGLSYDNYIGSLPQYNAYHENWNDFFYEQRLIKQLEMAFDTHKMDRSILPNFENLYKRLPEIMPDEPASLLHGDLWGGNILKDKDGKVAIIDPAVYYGNREMELAYTTMFDSHPSEFYHSYFEVFPLSPGFDSRVEIYNLYPLLVHVNLFGGGYINQVKHVVSKF